MSETDVTAEQAEVREPKVRDLGKTLDFLYPRGENGKPLSEQSQVGLSRVFRKIYSGSSVVQVRDELIKSHDFSSKIADLAKQSPISALDVLYQNVFGRVVDEGAVAHYSDALSTGQSDHIISSLVGSPEYHHKVVKELYEDVLGREPDTEGGTNYMRELNQGASIDFVLDALKNSEEYLAKETLPDSKATYHGRTIAEAWAEIDPTVQEYGPKAALRILELEDQLEGVDVPRETERSTSSFEQVGRLEQEIVEMRNLLEQREQMFMGLNEVYQSTLDANTTLATQYKSDLERLEAQIIDVTRLRAELADAKETNQDLQEHLKAQYDELTKLRTESLARIPRTAEPIDVFMKVVVGINRADFYRLPIEEQKKVIIRMRRYGGLLFHPEQNKDNGYANVPFLTEINNFIRDNDPVGREARREENAERQRAHDAARRRYS